jgi:hypothetical protein
LLPSPDYLTDGRGRTLYALMAFEGVGFAEAAKTVNVTLAQNRKQLLTPIPFVE